MNNLNMIHERLQNRFRMLRMEWQRACEQWDDPVRHRLEREIWREFESTVPMALDELRNLSELIAKAQRELG
jgi:hypothetical protein